MTETRFTLQLEHDFNNPLNRGGFHEVVIPSHLESLFHRGDVVDIVDRDESGPRLRGRIRVLKAVIEPIEP